MKHSILYAFGIIMTLFVIVGLSVLFSYNSLVNLNENRLSSWGDVETSYQRRNDLIPNLVNVVKGAAKFEQETLTKVIEARAKATSIIIKPNELNEASIQRFEEAQTGLNSTLSKLMVVVVEKYPTLTATQNFRDLQEQLEGTENRIAYVRDQFNKTTQNYNTKLKRFPTTLWVKMFYPKFEAQPYFQADEESKNAPKVNFSN